MKEGFEQESDIEPELQPANYSPGETIVGCTVKDVPSKPDELTKDGKRKLLPVCFKEDFVIILTEYPPDLRIGDKVNVVLVKLTRSHSKKKMAFGAVRDGR